MFFYSILLLGIALDLFSKYLAYIFLQWQKNILWDFLYFKYVENTWIAFSIQIPSFFLKILTITLIIFIFHYYKKEIKVEKDKRNICLLNISFWLILSWAIWNWVERVFNEKVIDFIWVKYFSVFNLADSFIFIWAIIYLYILFKNHTLWVSDQKR